jgi:hypothetical protein
VACLLVVFEEVSYKRPPYREQVASNEVLPQLLSLSEEDAIMIITVRHNVTINTFWITH